MSTNPAPLLINLSVFPFEGAEVDVYCCGFQEPEKVTLAPRIQIGYKPKGFWAETIALNLSLERRGGSVSGLSVMINHSSGGRDDSLSDIEAAKSFVASYEHAIGVAENFTKAFDEALGKGVSPAGFFFAVKDEIFDKLDNTTVRSGDVAL